MSVPVLLLAVVAVALAGPVPVLLGRAAWPARSPVLAALAWQAVALAGGLALLGAPLVWGLLPWGEGLVAAAPRLAAHLAGDAAAAPRPTGLPVGLHLMAVGAGAGIAVHLLLTTAVTAVRTLRARARHRDAVELVATGPADAGRWPGGARGARELPVDDPLAYCVPGSPRGGEALTVVSSGLLARLSPEELDAVVAHERAHLDQHHGLLRLAFAAWARACAWLPTAETARLAVVQVTEMLADDAALRRAPADVLVRALAQAAPGPDAGPAGQTDATGPTSAGLGDRAARLLTRPAPLPAAAAALVAAASLALPAATAAALLGLL